jgi:peptide subunit release factor 1 (eRF1)
MKSVYNPEKTHFIPDQLHRFLVIVADRRKARYFTVYKDMVEEPEEDVIDYVPQKVKAENTSPGKISRHITDHVYHHLKHVGKSALSFIRKKHIEHLDGVIIGGHKELLHKIREFLPAALQQKVVADFTTDVNIHIDNLTKRALSAVRYSM